MSRRSSSSLGEMSHEVLGIPPDTSLQEAAKLMAEESFFCLLVSRDDESLSPARQPDGGVTHFLSIEEDISGKKRTQAELERHRQHLETLVGERAIQLLQASQQAAATNRATFAEDREAAWPPA